jgi:large subunit ribosomal protein L33
MKPIGALGGSTGATLFADATGKLYVVKGGNSPDHIRSEAAANLIYKAAGVPVSRYTTDKNKTKTPGRLEKKKYNPNMKKHTLHRETK